MPNSAALPSSTTTVLRVLTIATFVVVLNETVLVNALPQLMSSLEVDERTQRPRALALDLAGGSVQVQAFAAPRSEGLWDEVRRELVQSLRPSTDGMRRIGVRQAADGGVPLGDTMPVSGDYTVGQRVEHPKFGVGIVQRIETLATDHKLVVAFDGAGEKTLLAKFAKLTKL